ncbi:MAG TPA: hypothetical protein DCY84_06190, partial [Firmicutes bacterium]|nr:hypothetical protein [Bacillota bacterium]
MSYNFATQSCCMRFQLRWHQLRSGDTFFNLAQQFNTTVECLQRLNSWAVPTNLPVGCWIVVGVMSPTTSDCRNFQLTWHQVRSGDTFFGLAQMFGTTAECLAFLNSWANPNALPVGCWVVV